MGLDQPVDDLQWVEMVEEERKKLSDRTIRQKTQVLANFIHLLCDGREDVATDVLQKFLARRHNVEDAVTHRIITTVNHAKDFAFDSIKSFHEYLNKLSGCTPDESAAKQAVATAVTFTLLDDSDDVKKPSLNALSEATGVSRHMLRKGQLLNEAMQVSGRRRFVHRRRKVNRNCTLPFLRRWVRENFCHNDKFSRIDSFSKTRTVKVARIRQEEGGGWVEDGFDTELHEPRIWTTTSITRLYKMCIESEEWKELIKENPSITMGRTTFSKCLCPCCGRAEA